MKELKSSGYGDDFSMEQTADAAAGKKWKSNSGSKANFAEKFWVVFIGDVPFEEADIAAQRLIQITPKALSGEQDFYLLSTRKTKQNPAIEVVTSWFLERAATPSSPE
ncbi:hypothetical protein Q4560_02205 [Celeribacter halophilus]|uniref:BRCT domain-containing protein n=1 Tax=Celeribacter halophilus TaxID=576117 RepID=A0AAW7XQ21_9RHOB|nr:hypothetical protein [Celeribacter halophilus]MDO6455877.1 hypothetical protein [Celeribacter halophilus]MDO6722066.1 hypothetical protein [Celeribacter halophilus]